MLITMDTWQKIREQFSEPEKASINAAYAGETICPRGIVVDEARLEDDLRLKLVNAKRGMRS